MPCYSPLKGFKDKVTGGLRFRRGSAAGEPMKVACGQCLGCRLDRSRMWAARIVHEATLWPTNTFVTLTYRDQDVPAGGTLVKSHFQKFMKRLRKKFPDRKIRYYHCGEYGDQLNRPHYHACLFNLDFADKELFKERDGNKLFVSQTLEDVWGYGFCTLGEVTFQSAAYCARYVLKKVTGHAADSHYERLDPNTGEIYRVEPEYVTMSRRPGIGKEWFDKYKSDVFPSDELPVPGQGVFKKVPRYYEEIYAYDDPFTIEDVKEARKKFIEENGEEYSPARLMEKYNVKKAQVRLLRRDEV